MATSARSKTKYFIAVGTNKLVSIKAVKNSVKDIADNLGWTEAPASGEVPDGKTLVGSGMAEALLNGCFPIALYYTKGGVERRAVVLCSPSKADTIATEGKASKYLGQNIIRVTPVRRRKFTY